MFRRASMHFRSESLRADKRSPRSAEAGGSEASLLQQRTKSLRRTLIAVLLCLSGALTFGQSAAQHPDWPRKGQLFVGTCYQPVDRSPEQIRQDIALMKQAGFTMVRMGDLSWDAFEPSEGQFEFAVVRPHSEADEPCGNQGDCRYRRIAGPNLASSQISIGEPGQRTRGDRAAG